jgi:hypothetical protein
MKKIYLFSFFLLVYLMPSVAQKADEFAESTFVVASQFGVTRPLRDIFAVNPVHEELIIKPKTSGDRKIRKPRFFEFSVEKDGSAYGNDSASMQTRIRVVKAAQAHAN